MDNTITLFQEIGFSEDLLEMTNAVNELELIANGFDTGPHGYYINVSIQIVFLWQIFVKSLQFAPRRVLFPGAVPAWVPWLPDHCWLDSDQQYHFVKVHVLCNYNYEEAIIDYFFAKPYVGLQCQFIGQFWI